MEASEEPYKKLYQNVIPISEKRWTTSLKEEHSSKSFKMKGGFLISIKHIKQR